MTERTIKITKYPTGWGFAECFPEGISKPMDTTKLPNIDLYTLAFQLRQLDTKQARDVSIDVLKKFAKRYKTKVVIVPV
jgi:hypothetical protein